MLCDYGCGTEATTQLKNKKWCCNTNTSRCAGQKEKNRLGLLKAYSEGRGGYSYVELLDETKLAMSRKGRIEMTVEEVFVNGKEWSGQLLRKYIHHYKLLEYKCSDTDCGITEWKNKDITLELDHISGERSDNRIGNLRWLCPNCHSQTPTFRGYNKSLTGKKKVSDQELLTALAECSNIRQALQKVGLAAKGGNYERATRLAKKCPSGEMVYTGDLGKI